MSVDIYYMTNGGFLAKSGKGDRKDWVAAEDYLELSQLASKLLKMSTYHILSPEEVKRFNDLTGAYSHDIK